MSGVSGPDPEWRDITVISAPVGLPVGDLDACPIFPRWSDGWRLFTRPNGESVDTHPARPHREESHQPAAASSMMPNARCWCGEPKAGRKGIESISRRGTSKKRQGKGMNRSAGRGQRKGAELSRANLQSWANWRSTSDRAGIHVCRIRAKGAHGVVCALGAQHFFPNWGNSV